VVFGFFVAARLCGRPNRNADSPDFGQILQAAQGTQVQLGLKFGF
jgi:hypothetical protein